MRTETKINLHHHRFRKSVRTLWGLSLEDVSKPLDCCPSHAWKIETGAAQPTLKQARVLSRLYKVPVETLFPSNEDKS